MASSSAPACPALFYYGAPDENCSHFAPYIRVTRENGKVQSYCDQPGGCDPCKNPLRFQTDPKCYGCQRKKMFARAHVAFFDETTSVPIELGQLKPFTARCSRLYSELVNDIFEHEAFWKGEDDTRARFSGNVLYCLAVELHRLSEEHQRYGNLEEADRVWGLAFYFLRRHNALAEKLGDAKALANGREMVPKFWEKELKLAVDKDETERVADILRTLAGFEAEEGLPIANRPFTQLLNVRLQSFDGQDSTHDMAGDRCMRWEAIMLLLGSQSQDEGRVKGPAAKEEDRKSMCGVCGVKVGQKKLMRCTKCLSIWYCGRSCQALDWKSHKAECKAIGLSKSAATYYGRCNHHHGREGEASLLPGRGNALRLALVAANIPFEDAYPSGGYPPTDEDRDKWRALGGNTTTNVPMLEMPDGKVYTQSSAVLRAIGRMGNLLPSDDEGLNKVDKLIADAEDLRGESYKCFIPWGASQESADNFINTVLPLHLGNLERQLKQSSGGYFVGDSLTIADVTCYDAVVNFGSNRVPTALEAFPVLSAWKERMESDAGIKKYLASEAYKGLGKFGPETVGK